jgi:hypothetical protein
MKTKLLLVIPLLCALISCSRKPEQVNGVYKYYAGERGTYKIWIVNGDVVRAHLYREFLYGGNEQRYLFNPVGEIWVDDAVSCEEYEMTVAHELNERHLMAKFGWTYDKAHDSSLMVEVAMRRNFERICRQHEDSLPPMPVTDYENAKEIRDIPDSVKLMHIYRVPLGKQDGISIWIVDGYLIRKNFYPDFGNSGNDQAYHFIPPREIWIDGQISASETEYSIALELKERELMAKGMSYDDAYETAIAINQQQRLQMEKLVNMHPPVMIPDSTTRDSGEIDPNEP